MRQMVFCEVACIYIKRSGSRIEWVMEDVSQCFRYKNRARVDQESEVAFFLVDKHSRSNKSYDTKEAFSPQLHSQLGQPGFGVHKHITVWGLP